jgi:hypothetical protein
MTQATIQITNKLPTDTGFAIRQDDGSYAQTFVPSHIMRGAGLEVGATAHVILIENDAGLVEFTPWRVTQMQVEPPKPEPVAAAIVQAKTWQGPSIDMDIYGELLKEDFASTGEIARSLGLEVGVVRDRLLAFFNANKIVMASVYSRPNLKRASFTLWAIYVDDFGIETGEE